MNVPVEFTVNGTTVRIDVEPRMTLADALRQRLRLTGTHLGCEHGVCGACTVLVDGRAVRSCLMFAPQAQGAEVVTVEALGTPEDLHPLQAAFREHHGLQCGFCTPGFLLSAYELLRDHPDVASRADLAEELSGVLCRCTGYRGVLAAVRATARDHPGSLPPPGNLEAPIRPVGDSPSPDAVGAAEAQPDEAAVASRDLVVPTGDPTAVVTVHTDVAAAPEETWRLLSDVPRVARCLPGAELGEEVAADTYRGRLRMSVGPMRFDFVGAARIIERDESGRTIRVVGAGAAAGGSGQLDVTLRAAASGSGTRLTAETRLFLVGRVAQFGRSIVGDVSAQLFREFGSCLDASLAGSEDPAVPARLPAARLAWRTLIARAQALRSVLSRWRR